MLVTGASGFIGGHLVARLRAQGRSVRCLVRPTSRIEWLRPSGCEIVSADLARPETLERALDGVDTIYHLAGVTKAPSRQGYFEANQGATESLLEAVTRYGGGVRRLVHVSSLAAAGPSDDDPIDEDDPPRPISVYGLSKLRGEEAVVAYRGQAQVVVVRPPVVYGPRDRGVLPFFRLATHRIRVAVGWRERRLSLVHVDDLVTGLLVCGEHPAAAGRIYFVTDGVPCTWADVTRAIANAVGKRSLPVVVPEVMVKLAGAGAYLAGRVARRVTVFNRDKAVEICARHWVCDGSRIERELGFRPRVDLQTGMRSTFEWYRRQDWL
ncbi:MAG: NAD-dependent epimerase/dehydratase family protein [Planctomycetota bacterium]